MDFIAEGFIQAFRMLLTMDEETAVIVVTTFKLTALSMAGVLLFGLPAGFLLGYFDFPGEARRAHRDGHAARASRPSS